MRYFATATAIFTDDWAASRKANVSAVQYRIGTISTGYRMPVPDARYRERLLAKNLQSSDKYVLCTCSSLFSQLRDARLMANALADTLLEPEMVTAFLDRIAEHEVSVIQTLGGCGIGRDISG